ncbi:MAG TPA: SelB C-terminal domain-containing protein, partial [Bacillales bacterium]|nr:SelB C-terminal domain-containing protein [Bacillales bacterium]
LDKAEMIQSASAPAVQMEAVIEHLKEDERIRQQDQYLALFDFVPSIPEEWSKKMKEVIAELRECRLEVKNWDVLSEEIPESLRDDLKHYLLQQGQAYKLDEERLIHKDSLLESVHSLLRETEGSSIALKQAKDVLNVSRKYLIPFLELLDHLKLTVRDGNERKWVNSTIDRYFD